MILWEKHDLHDFRTFPYYLI